MYTKLSVWHFDYLQSRSVVERVSIYLSREDHVCCCCVDVSNISSRDDTPPIVLISDSKLSIDPPVRLYNKGRGLFAASSDTSIAALQWDFVEHFTFWRSKDNIQNLVCSLNLTENTCEAYVWRLWIVRHSSKRRFRLWRSELTKSRISKTPLEKPTSYKAWFNESTWALQSRNASRSFTEMNTTYI